jgi:spermidine/putrescine transport system permease protein
MGDVMRRRGLGAGLVTVATLLFLFVPLGVVVLFSFQGTAGLTLPFEGLSLRWYRQVFGDETFSEALTNSIILGVATAAVTVGLGTPAAYGVTHSRSKLGTPLQVLFLIPVLLPGLFIGAALLSFLGRIEFDPSLVTVLIGHVVFAFPFVFLLTRTALERLDPSLEEVARDLGASAWLVFRRVTLPQIAPVLAGAAALAFMISFDEFLITFFVIGDEQTLPVYIFARLRRTVDPGINVASTLLLAVTLLVWLAAAVAAWRAARTDRAAARIGVAQ